MFVVSERDNLSLYCSFRNEKIKTVSGRKRGFFFFFMENARISARRTHFVCRIVLCFARAREGPPPMMRSASREHGRGLHRCCALLRESTGGASTDAVLCFARVRARTSAAHCIGTACGVSERSLTHFVCRTVPCFATARVRVPDTTATLLAVWRCSARWSASCR